MNKKREGEPFAYRARYNFFILSVLPHSIPIPPPPFPSLPFPSPLPFPSSPTYKILHSRSSKTTINDSIFKTFCLHLKHLSAKPFKKLWNHEKCVPNTNKRRSTRRIVFLLKKLNLLLC